MADNLYMLAACMLSLWRHFDKKRKDVADVAGFTLNTVLLLIASIFILYRLWFGELTRELFPLAIGAVGVLGLIGNSFQALALGEIDWEDASNRQGALQHVWYDAINSGAIIVGALVIAFVGPMIGGWVDKSLAALVAAGMLWTCWKNYKKIKAKVRAPRH